jgi:hypothetical protein
MLQLSVAGSAFRVEGELILGRAYGEMLGGR